MFQTGDIVRVLPTPDGSPLYGEALGNQRGTPRLGVGHCFVVVAGDEEHTVLGGRYGWVGVRADAVELVPRPAVSVGDPAHHCPICEARAGEVERLKAEHETSVRLGLLPPHPLTYADDDTDRGRTCGGCRLPVPGGFRDAHMQWCGRRHWMPPRRTKIAGVDAEALRALADDMLSEHHLTPAYLVGERLLAVFALVDSARAERDEALHRGRLEGATAMLAAAHEAINEKAKLELTAQGAPDGPMWVSAPTVSFDLAWAAPKDGPAKP